MGQTAQRIRYIAKYKKNSCGRAAGQSTKFAKNVSCHFMGVLAEYKYYFLECWGWESRLKIDVSTGAQYGLPNLSTHIKSNGTSYLGQIFNETDWLIWFRLWVLTQAEAIITMWTLKKIAIFWHCYNAVSPKGTCIVNAYCQFSQQACTNFMQIYLYSLISTHFFILINLHWKY